MEIVRATVKEAETILNIQKNAYLSEAKLNDDYSIPPLTESLEEIKEVFKSQIFLKAIIGDEIVGSVRTYVKENTCYIGRLIVSNTLQNQGIGTRLMKQIEKEYPNVKRYELYTGKKSERNIYLYQKLGYNIFKEQELNSKTTLVYLEKIR